MSDDTQWEQYATQHDGAQMGPLAFAFANALSQMGIVISPETDTDLRNMRRVIVPKDKKK